MQMRRIVASLCVVLLAPGPFVSVLASRKIEAQSRGGEFSIQAATLVINEYLADPAGSGAGDLAGDANGDGVRDPADDEFIEVVNNGAAPLNVGMFTISDATSVRFTFPVGKVIPPGEAAVVFGGGTPTGAFGNATANGLVFTAGSGGLSLNNGGDTITVKDNVAATVATLTFGSTEGNANQSITRSPDVTGGFVQHSTAPGSGGTLFSPGARVNGAPFTTTDPSIDSISPEGAVAGSGEVTITVTGNNYHDGSKVRVDGMQIATEFFNPQTLVAEVPASVTNSPGTHSITVQNPDLVASNSVTFTVLNEVGINEYLADPPDGPSGDANGDGVRDSAQDEFVEVLNRTGAPVDVGGFTIRDADAQRFAFPPGTVIPAGEAAVIFGGGSPQGEFGNAHANGLVFTAALSLNNTGDTITLKNGAATLESITYGSGEGNANQSINRNPDITGIALANHSSVPGAGGRLFSPGTQVNGSAFTVGPRITSISPTSALQDSPPFDLIVVGTGFDGASKVLIDGQQVTSGLTGVDRLSARVPASVLAIVGAHSVQVRNEGGNHSNFATLTIVSRPPSLLSLTPKSGIVNAGIFTLFVNGLNFDPGAVVLVEGTVVATSFISSRDLKATVPASFTTTLGIRRVVVRNSDGKQSLEASFEVIQPFTVITSIAPATVIAGGPGVDVLIRGANFRSGAIVLFDQTELASKFNSPSEISAQIPASLLLAIGVHSVSVRNSDGSFSNEMVFQILPDPPIINSLDPSSVLEGSGDVTITLDGNKFQAGAVVRAIEGVGRGVPLATTFISSQRLQAKLPAALTQKPGVVMLAVENPDSGFSTSIELNVAIKDPLVINEYLADPPEGLIGDANGDGTRSSSSDEFVEILNRTSGPLDISGYQLSDADAVRHVFAAGTVVPPFEAVVVFGGGTPTGPFGNAAENHLVFKASSGGLSLNNGGDTIILQDAQGHPVQEINFGAAEGGAGQSINRDPDGDGSTFAPHTMVAEDFTRLFSPGTKAAGQTFTIKPSIRAITPSSIRAGSSQFNLLVSGSNFLPGAVVLLGTTVLPTVSISNSLLDAQVAASLITAGGTADVRVRNPRGELSSTVRLLIVDDPPRAIRITPDTTGTGAENLEVSIAGERFQRGAVVLVQNEAVETRFVSSVALVAVIPNKLFDRASELSVLVVNADGNRSNTLTLTVENGPLITRLSKKKTKAGRGVLELTVGGVAFKPGVVLFVNDIAVSTSFVSEAEFTARIPAEMTNQPGVLTLQARHPNGARSNTAKLKVVQ